MTSINTEEEKILQLWQTGDEHNQDEAIEKIEKTDFKLRTGLFLLEAFKRNMFDFIEKIGSMRFDVYMNGWGDILFQAGASGDLELIKKAREYTENVDEHWCAEEKERKILMGLSYGGHHSPMAANDYKDIEDFEAVVIGIIHSKQNETWDKLNPQDLKLIIPQDQLYLIACQVDNFHILQSLENLGLVPTSIAEKLESLIVLGKYKELEQILQNTSAKDIDDHVYFLFKDIIKYCDKSDSHQKILRLLISRFGLFHPQYSLRDCFIKLFRHTNNGGLQKFKQRKLFYQTIIICSSSFAGRGAKGLASLLTNDTICTNVSSLKKWIYDVDDLEVIIKSGLKNLEPIRKKLPELFCQQNLIVLFLRQPHLLAKTNYVTKKGLKCLALEVNSIKKYLLQFFYSPLVDIVLSYF